MFSKVHWMNLIMCYTIMFFEGYKIQFAWVVRKLFCLLNLLFVFIKFSICSPNYISHVHENNNVKKCQFVY